MDTEVIVALIGIAPSALATIGIITVAIIFREPIRTRILPRLAGLKILGVEITLLKEDLDAATSRQLITVSEGDKWNALSRAQHVMPVLNAAKLLWVDDEAQNNQELIKILRSLHVNVTLAQDTAEALKLLKRYDYHVVVSDISRSGGSNAGLEMVKQMWDQKIYRWTIFYVRNLEPGIPDYAFNITNRPDHLLHFIMDVLERERWRLES
ncbi:hypothetical protein [Candidatus Leptofilum sp.]|uniref:hypothetical protein n=1 Tax=Candidatus Leptofilum sp. TaxID=3241576 RepID=UPI003B5CA87B